MKTTFCTTKKKAKTYFIFLESLTIDDLVWLKSRDEKKAQFLHYLSEKAPERLKLVKASNENNETLLIFPLEIIPIDLSTFYGEKSSLWSKLGKKVLSMCNLKVAHPRYSLLYDMDLSVADAQLVSEAGRINLITEAIDEASRNQCLNIVTIPSGVDSTQLHERLFRKQGYERPAEDFTMHLSLQAEWTCFEDYVASLKRKYGKRALSIKKKAQGLELRILDLEQIIAHQTKINALYEEVLSKQKFAIDKAAVDHFSTLKKCFNDSFELVAVFSNTEIVAFFTYFKEQEQLSVHYVGLCYKLNEKYDLYFNILYWALEQGIAQRKPYIDFGRTSLDAKASLGAVPKPRYTYVKTNCLPKVLKKYVVYQLTKLENTGWQIRKPFKADSSVLEEA